MKRFLLAISIQLSVFSFLMAADIMPEEAIRIANAVYRASYALTRSNQQR